MAESDRTCDQCQHYSNRDWPVPQGKPASSFAYSGTCALMKQGNDDLTIDGVTSYCDCGFEAGNGTGDIGVGPKFGCIHWLKKE